MDEHAWLTGTDPQAMLSFLRDSGELSERRARLFAVACCRRVRHLLADERSQRAVEVAEQYAEGQVGRRTAAKWRRVLRQIRESLPLKDHQFTPEWLACHAVEFALAEGRDSASLLLAHNEVAHAMAVATGEPTTSSTFRAAWKAEARHLSTLVQDIFGTPFRPVAVNPVWHTPTVLALARQMYESKEFSAMPILADALEEAGCRDEQVLGHLRGPGVHVRGCWAVDLCLGKGSGGG